MNRKLVPELLDDLPPDHPDAEGARRDLRCIHFFMRNTCILSEALDRLRAIPRRIVELGAGDGTLLLQALRRQQNDWTGGEIIFIDLVNVVSEETRAAYEELGWKIRVQEGDALKALPEADLILANLFLHHFEGDDLTGLLREIAEKTPSFLSIEPRRNRIGLAGTKLLGLIGCNHVTRHDAYVSVGAGFTGHELSDLWPSASAWKLSERAGFPFSHLFVAETLYEKESQP